MEPERKSLPSTSGTQSFAESVIARKKAEEMARRAEEEEDEVERETEKPEEQQEAAAMDEGPMDPREAADMALAVAMEMEEKRKREAAERGEDDSDSDGQEGDDEGVVYSLDEITASMQKGAHPGAVKGLTKVQGPQEDAAVAAANERASKDLLDSYWQFVRENPNDFQGWTYLIQHVENIDDLDEVRTAYNAFLPLYPYCFAYWQRYSEIEKKHEKWQRALAILHRGLEAIPLSVDLWVSYLELYKKMYVDNADFADLFRQQCERAVQTVGLEYRSDVLWERYVDDKPRRPIQTSAFIFLFSIPHLSVHRYVEWEAERGDLKWITGILKRVVGIPTKMYNKHWDNFIAHIRDHHPRDILDYDEYEELRKVTCAELEVPYAPGMQDVEIFFWIFGFKKKW